MAEGYSSGSNQSLFSDMDHLSGSKSKGLGVALAQTNQLIGNMSLAFLLCYGLVWFLIHRDNTGVKGLACQIKLLHFLGAVQKINIMAICLKLKR